MIKQQEIHKTQEAFDESNLLDSYSKPKRYERILEGQSEVQSEEEYLQKVQNILQENNRQKMSSQEIMLQAQVIELQMKCNTLSVANQRLVEKLNAEKNEGKRSKEQAEYLSSTSDISQFQGELSEIEEYILSFKSQFSFYQNKVNHQLKMTEEKLHEQEKEIEKLGHAKQQLERNLKEEKQNNLRLLKRNQELLMEIEDELERKFQLQSYTKPDYTYGNQIQYQLEQIIEKLAAELKHEREMKKKYYSEMKDLTKELNESEKTIQRKNQTIYNLELKVLKGEKKNLTQDRSLRKSRQIESRVKKRQSKFMAIQLTSILTEEVKIKEWAILIICSKLLEIYDDQIKNREIKISMKLEDIVVENFNENHLPLLRLKTKSSLSISKSEFFFNTLNIVNELLSICIDLQSKDSMLFLMEELDQKMKQQKIKDVHIIKRMIDEIILEEGQKSKKS